MDEYGQTPRSARVRVIGALLLAGLGGSGCYRYVPIQPSAVRPNEEVRVLITDDAAARVVKEFGTYAGELEGQLATAESDSIAVSVLIARAYRGVSLDNVRQTLFLSRSEVVEVRRRQISRGRTVLAAAGVLAAFGVLVNTVVQMGDPNPRDDDPPPPPPGVRSVLIRIPIR